jgi:solute carrier family 26, other
MNEVLRPWLSKRCRLPLPAELIVVIGFTAMSYFLNLKNNYGVAIAGNIPTGLLSPVIPSFELVRKVLLDSIALAFVTWSTNVSMALIFSKKDKYEIDANQELLAIGLANMVGSCFSCVPLACGLSRSVIQHYTGGKTQIVTVVSATLILSCKILKNFIP